MFTITMIPSFRMIFPRNTHILKQKWLINKPLKTENGPDFETKLRVPRRLNTD